MSEAPPEGLCVQFDAESIAAYGGTGVGIHSDPDAAKDAGFDALVSWGTLTIMPFWELLDRAESLRGLAGVRLNVQLRRPVLAGDRVRYSMRELQDEHGQPAVELEAATDRLGIVATAVASALAEGRA